MGMRVHAVILLATLIAAPAALAGHGGADRIGVGLRLAPCHVVAETGAQVAYILEVTNDAPSARSAHVTVAESTGAVPQPLNETLTLASDARRLLPFSVTAPDTPGLYQFTTIANLSDHFSGTHAELAVVASAGDPAPAAIGACAARGIHAFPLGDEAVLDLEVSQSGLNGSITYTVEDASNTTLANGTVSPTQALSQVISIPLGVRSAAPGDSTYRVTLASVEESHLVLAFNILVTWDPTLPAAAGGGLLESAPTTVVIGAALLAGGAAAIALGRLFTRRFAPAWFLAGLYSRFARGEILEHPARERIYEAITTHPGLTVKALAEHTGSYIGAVAYHLRVLEHAGFVATRSEPAGRRVFPTGVRLPDPSPLTATQERILGVLRAGPLSAKELAATLGTTRQGAHYHLRALEKRGLVEVSLAPGGHLVYEAPRVQVQRSAGEGEPAR